MRKILFIGGVVLVFGYIGYDAFMTNQSYQSPCEHNHGFAQYISFQQWQWQWQEQHPGIYENMKLIYAPYFRIELQDPKTQSRIQIIRYTDKLPHHAYVQHDAICTIDGQHVEVIAEATFVYAGQYPLPQLFWEPTLTEKLFFWRNKSFCGNLMLSQQQFNAEAAT